jgi:signal transduction histidine kinase
VGLHGLLDAASIQHDQQAWPELPVALLRTGRDAAECFHAANVAAARLLGYDAVPELLRLSPRQVYVDPQAHHAIIRGLVSHQSPQTVHECQLRRKDHSSVWVSVRASCGRNGRPDRGEINLVLLDITDRVHAEEETRGYQQQLRSMALELSLAEERERRRLAGHLHDEVAQLLSLAQIRLSMVSRSAKAKTKAGIRQELGDLLGRALQATRSLTFQLSHPALYDLGFVAGAEWLVEDFQKLYGLDVTLDDDHQPKPIDLRVRVVLFQCLRELLVNAAKHAKVKSASVSIARAGDAVEVRVSDEGVGCKPHVLNHRKGQSHSGGFGLFSIRERLNSLGGKMELESAPGHGTTVTLQVPISCEPLPQTA